MKLLPVWHRYLDMLNFAVEYQKALDAISADCDMELRKFELTENEWKIVAQLRDMLKVSCNFSFSHILDLGACLRRYSRT